MDTVKDIYLMYFEDQESSRIPKWLIYQSSVSHIFRLWRTAQLNQG